jgi:hypothetical protein
VLKNLPLIAGNKLLKMLVSSGPPLVLPGIRASLKRFSRDDTVSSGRDSKKIGASEKILAPRAFPFPQKKSEKKPI